MSEPGQLPGGCALTKGLRARARRGPGGEGAGALLRALEGGGCESHSEEPAATATEHTQLCPGLGPAAFQQTRQPPGSHTCGAATCGCRPAPPPGRSPPSDAGPAPCPEAKPRPLCARSAVSGLSGSIALALLSCPAAGWGALGGTFFTPGSSRRSRLGFGEGKK